MNKSASSFFFFFNLHYLSPGKAHRWGSHHKQGPLVPVVGSYADGLHRLTQAHVVSQEESALFGHGKTVKEAKSAMTKKKNEEAFSSFCKCICAKG